MIVSNPTLSELQMNLVSRIRGQDAESLQRIWGERRNACIGRNGRAPDAREMPLGAISVRYLRPRDN